MGHHGFCLDLWSAWQNEVVRNGPSISGGGLFVLGISSFPFWDFCLDFCFPASLLFCSFAILLLCFSASLLSLLCFLSA